MSFGTILAELGEGRYTIQLDLGEAQRQQLLDAATAAIARYDLQLLQAQADLVVQENAEAAMRLNIQTQVEALVAIQADDPQMAGPAAKAGLALYDVLYKQYIDIVARNQPLRRSIKNLKIAIRQAQQLYNRWFNFVAVQQRNAWCVDFTEGATGDVGLLEINGEQDLLLIAPGASPLYSGRLVPREFQSPEQVYFNTAILPGWQKFYPNFRWGTVQSINFETDKMTVELAPATSSAQGLDINQSATLVDVPCVYMTCNCSAFEEGDRVVVDFQGQNWANPRVIGFLDNPRPCGNFLAFRATVSIGQPGTVRGLFVRFRCDNTDGTNAVDSIITNKATVTAQYRINSGAWGAMALESTVGDAQWRHLTSSTEQDAGIVVRNTGLPYVVPGNRDITFEMTRLNIGDTLEIRLMSGATVLFSAAAEMPDPATGYVVSSDAFGSVYGGVSVKVKHIGGIDNSNVWDPSTDPNPISRLNYTLDVP